MDDIGAITPTKPVWSRVDEAAKRERKQQHPDDHPSPAEEVEQLPESEPETDELPPPQPADTDEEQHEIDIYV